MTVFGGKPGGARLERMQASPRYRDGAFHNLPVAPGLRHGPMPGLASFLLGGGRRKPPGPLPAVDPRPAWGRPIDTGLRATWLGHSTVLLEIDGVRVLTDPVFGERASPVKLAGPRRFHRVPATIAQLPAIDLVVLSHDHYDHLCSQSVVQLAKRGTPIVTALGVGA